MIKFLIYFKVAFNQYFLTSAGNQATSTKQLGSGIKYDNSKPDFPNKYNGLLNSFKTTLNNLCKPFLIFFDDISAPLHSLCAYRTQPGILNLAYLALISRCTLFTPQTPSISFVLIDMLSASLSIYDSSI